MGLHCIITGESDAMVRVCGGQQDREIYKELILAVEQIPVPQRLH